jgi:hypothetical protein
MAEPGRILPVFENIEDAFVTMGVARDASDEVLKQEFATLCRKYHPDKAKSAADHELFAKINEAYRAIVLYRSATKPVFNIELECLAPCVVTNNLDVNEDIEVIRKVEIGQIVKVDIFDRTSQGKERARCNGGWVSMDAKSGIQLFKRVPKRLADETDTKKEQRKKESETTSLGESFILNCVSPAAFSPEAQPGAVVTHISKQGDRVEFYEIKEVGSNVRVRTKWGWASLVSRNGTKLLGLVPEVDRALLLAQRWWRGAQVRIANRRKHDPRYIQQVMEQEKFEASIDVTGVWKATGEAVPSGIKEAAAILGLDMREDIAAAAERPQVFKKKLASARKKKIREHSRDHVMAQEVRNGFLLLKEAAARGKISEKEEPIIEIRFWLQQDDEVIYGGAITEPTSHNPDFTQDNEFVIRSGTLSGNQLVFFQAWPDGESVKWSGILDRGAGTIEHGQWGGAGKFVAMRETDVNGHDIAVPPLPGRPRTDSKQIYVAGLPQASTADEIKEIFNEAVGKVDSVEILNGDMVYAVVKGQNHGLFGSWAEASANGKGKFEKFGSAKAALEYISQYKIGKHSVGELYANAGGTEPKAEVLRTGSRGLAWVNFGTLGPVDKLLEDPSLAPVIEGQRLKFENCVYPPPAETAFPGSVTVSIKQIKGVKPTKISTAEKLAGETDYGDDKHGITLKIRCGEDRVEGKPLGKYWLSNDEPPIPLFELTDAAFTHTVFDLLDPDENPRIVVEVFREHGELQVPVGQIQCELGELFEPLEAPNNLQPAFEPKNEILVWKELEAMAGMYRSPTAEIRIGLSYETQAEFDRKEAERRAEEERRSAPEYLVGQKKEEIWNNMVAPEYVDGVWGAAHRSAEKARKKQLVSYTHCRLKPRREPDSTVTMLNNCDHTVCCRAWQKRRGF